MRERELHLDVLAQTESIFALSNGYLGLRGNLDEGEPHGVPGTYLNGCYELRPLPYPEPGYGIRSRADPGNVTSGKLIRLLVDDDRSTSGTGLTQHERCWICGRACSPDRAVALPGRRHDQ